MSAQDRKKTIPATPFSGTIPQFYGSPKIHKTGRLKIRPIISDVDIYCDRLLLHLKSILNVLFRSEYAVLNSYDFVNRLEGVRATAKDRMASLDVESLFTKVPVAQTPEIVQRRMTKMRESEEGREELELLTSLSTNAFMSLLNLVVQDFYFCWEKKLYWQRAGLPMGSRLSLVLANTFLEEMEVSVLQNIPVQPKLYVRFVDDIFVLYDESEFSITDFLDTFNDQHCDIHLTLERENRRALPYLDLLIWRRYAAGGLIQEGLDLSIHRKSTHSHKFLNYRSSNPLSLKRNVFRGLWMRAQRLLRNHPANLQ